MTSEQGYENRMNGARFEIRVMNILKKTAKLVVHSAGSFGLFDLIALTYEGKVRLINCKTDGYLSPKERRALRKYIICKQAENESVELYYYINKRKIGRKTLTREMV